MKKRWLCTLSVAVAICALFSLGGCNLYGNSREGVHRIAAETQENEIKFYLNEWQTLVYANESVTLDKEIDYRPYEGHTVLDGSTFPKHMLWVEEGYDGLDERLCAEFALDSALFHAYAEEREGIVYGFCNVYTTSTGYFSGGGQPDADKVYNGILFAYDNRTDEIVVLDEVRRACIVGFDQTHFIYYYKKAYYAQEIGGEDCVKICKDDAYDSGITHYSYAQFYFTDGYCVLHFHRGYNNSKKDYDRFVLCKMNGNLLGEIKL